MSGKATKRWSERLIILLLVGSVAVPVGLAELPTEIAKWHIAAAANALLEGDIDRAKSKLTEAVETSPAVAQLPDYWALMFRVNAANPPDQIVDFLKTIVKSDSSARLAGAIAAEQLSERGDFRRALECLKIAYDEQSTLDAQTLNMLAYYRALADTELDVALKQIDQALDELPGEAALLDTKAWVLFKQGKYKPALAIINQAIEKVLETLPESLREAPEDYDPAGLGKNELGKPGTEVSKENLKSIAALRYHRMRILQELGDEEKSLLDFRAIRFWGFEPDDRLF